MKAGDLVKVHLLNDLDWREALGVFMGYQGRKDGHTSHSFVYADGRNLRFESMDVKAVK
tara:strand:- start:1306 stop:1482 length:177 start_codon:yes stop_codon:yes gene_type:complete